MSASPDSIPVVVVTGFLGAGKTTLVNRIIADPAFADTAIVVNEFGAVDVDGDLVRLAAGDFLVTTNGCLCCTTSADLRGTLFDLYETARTRLSRSFSRVIVETTGLADPAPVINMLTPGGLPAYGLRDHTVSRHFHLAGVIALVDAVTGDMTLDRYMEAVKQVAFADRILLTKTDLLQDPASRRDLKALRERIAARNPAAMIVDAPPDLSIETLFRARYAPGKHGGDATGWLAIDRLRRDLPTAAMKDRARPSAHHDDIASMVLHHEGPVSRAAIDVFLTLLQNAAGTEVLRVKGLISLCDDPGRPAVVHMVRHVVHPIDRLETWPSPDRSSRIVVIGRGLAVDRLQPLFDALVSRSDIPARREWADLLPIAVASTALLIGLAAFFFATPNPSAADPVGTPTFQEIQP